MMGEGSRLEELLGRTADVLTLLVILWIAAQAARSASQLVWTEGFRAGFNAHGVATESRRRPHPEEVPNG